MKQLLRSFFPLIIKPVNSSGSRGLKKIGDEGEFRKIHPEIVTQYGFPLVQEYIPATGEGCGVGILALDGAISAGFSYRRLREFPVSGGPSTLRESTDDPETKHYAAMLMKELNWGGVAMVEFKRDRQGTPRLMEINPRFWGSLDLAYVSGINFPYLLFLQSQNEPVEQPFYEPGIRGRWFFPGDIAHFLANSARFSMKPSFFNFFDKRTFYDDFKRDDMKGNIAVLLCTAAMFFRPKYGVSEFSENDEKEKYTNTLRAGLHQIFSQHSFCHRRYLLL
jgi:predicted ATP-grasp superfamily ATP-dependent carboligase